MSTAEVISSEDEQALQSAVDPPTEPAAPGGGEGRRVDPEACEQLKQSGNKLFSEGLVSEALEVYREALKVAPLKPRRKIERHDNNAPPPADGGDTENKDSKTEATSENITEPQTDDAENEDVEFILTSQVYANAGLCLFKLEMYAEAVEYLGEAIWHNKKYTKAYLRRAECYYVLCKWSEAYGDYEGYEKLGGTLDALGRAHKAETKAKVDEEMQKMLGELKTVGNRFLNYFGLSTDNFKFDKDANTGGYSMRFEK